MTLPYFPSWSLTVEESEGGKAALGSHTEAQICCASVSLSAARVLCLPDPHSLPDSRDTPVPREQPGPGKRVPGLGPGSATDPGQAWANHPARETVTRSFQIQWPLITVVPGHSGAGTRLPTSLTVPLQPPRFGFSESRDAPLAPEPSLMLFLPRGRRPLPLT